MTLKLTSEISVQILLVKFDLRVKHEICEVTHYSFDAETATYRFRVHFRAVLIRPNTDPSIE